MTSDFSNRVAVVTGAASGIGAACARELAAAGARLIAIDLQPPKDTVARIRQDGGTCFELVGDVTSNQTWETAADLCKGLGGAHVLMNVAGFSQLNDHALDIDEQDWERLLGVNLKAHWLAIKHLVPQMRALGGGAIVNMSSIAAVIGAPNHAAYSASKGGVLALTRQCAIEFAPDGIRVNAVCPGPVDTPMVQTNTPEAMDAILDAVPLSRMATPEEVAKAMTFLASDFALSITGAALAIDGGMSASL